VIETAADLDVDLIALGWSRSLAGGHGPVVREALASSTVPVLLLPLGNSSTKGSTTLRRVPRNG
jgi:hypothetical protein